MIASLKQLKNRIKSVENTRAITRAMEMVSTAKLKNCDAQLRHLRDYCRMLDGIASRAIPACAAEHPYFGPAGRAALPGKVFLFVIGGDNGLCGGFNQNILRCADAFVNAHPGAQIMAVGKKSHDHFARKGAAVRRLCPGMRGRFSVSAAGEICRSAEESFLSSTGAEVYAAGTVFVSAMNYKPVIRKLLPFERGRRFLPHIFEPGESVFMDAFLPGYLRGTVTLLLLESLTAEHSARAAAMKAATDNAKELLEYLIVSRNKMRQAMITREMIELISSVEALKG